jgi:hypothetical protein
LEVLVETRSPRVWLAVVTGRSRLSRICKRLLLRLIWVPRPHALWSALALTTHWPQ